MSRSPRSALKRICAVAVAAALVACEPAAGQLGGGPAGADGASALVLAIAERFGPQEREPEFEELRLKLARAALVPSWVFDDPAPGSGAKARGGRWSSPAIPRTPPMRWACAPRRPTPSRRASIAGGCGSSASRAGGSSGGCARSSRSEHVRPAELAATLDALFRGAEATDEAKARAAIAAAFPRASAKLGLALAPGDARARPGRAGRRRPARGASALTAGGPEGDRAALRGFPGEVPDADPHRAWSSPTPGRRRGGRSRASATCGRCGCACATAAWCRSRATRSGGPRTACG